MKVSFSKEHVLVKEEPAFETLHPHTHLNFVLSFMQVAMKPFQCVL